MNKPLRYIVLWSVLWSVLWIASWMFILALPAEAQDRVINLRAETFRARQVDGRTIFDLVRPVLTQDETKLSSEFGTDEGNGYVRFWGNVEIIEVEDTLKADRVRYHKDTKVGVAEGNVYMTDGVARLRSPFATYYSDDKKTRFESGVQYSDSSGVLTAARGEYFSELNEARFSGKVRFEQEKTLVFADSLEYIRAIETSTAWGRVLVDQKTDTTSTIIFSDFLFRNARTDSMAVTGSAVLTTIDTATADTVFVLANRFSILDRDGRTSLSAQDSVLVSAPEYAVRGDSLHSLNLPRGLRLSTLHGNPMAWLERNQVSADSLRFIMHQAGPDSVLGFGRVFVASEDSASGRIQQLKGQRMTAIVIQDSLRTLILEENAEAIFYTRGADSDSLKAVKASADGVVFEFEDGKAVDIRFYEGVKGAYYAENLLDQLVNLAGFVWKPENMPVRDVLSSMFRAELSARTHSPPQ